MAGSAAGGDESAAFHRRTQVAVVALADGQGVMPYDHPLSPGRRPLLPPRCSRADVIDFLMGAAGLTGSSLPLRPAAAP